MNKITELDNKYIVVKREDIKKYLSDVMYLSEVETDEENLFYKLLNNIGHGREDDTKI